jgi:hypothetical protein
MINGLYFSDKDSSSMHFMFYLIDMNHFSKLKNQDIYALSLAIPILTRAKL